MKRRLPQAVICLVLWTGAAEAGTLRKWCGAPIRAIGDEEHGGQVVSLSGIVVSKPERGPPGWGETPKLDNHWTAWFIKLDYATPMIVPNFDTWPIGLQTKIELEIQVRGKFEFDGTYKRLRGQHVIVTGPLGQGAEPTNLGDAQIETTKVEIVGAVDCEGKIKP